MGKNHHTRQKTEIAQQAAKLMIENGIRDYKIAKTRAASQLGLQHAHIPLPSNSEIDHEREVLLKLFYKHETASHLKKLRHLALNALKLLQPFTPYLVGDIVNGIIDSHSKITIHIYEANIEEIEVFLMEKTIPYEHKSVTIKTERNKQSLFSRLCFEADKVPIEIIALPYTLFKSPPLNPVDGHPYKRMDLQKLEAMLAGQ